MKKFRIIVLAFSIVVFVVFGFVTIRDMITSDHSAPVITADSDSIEASVSATDEELLRGMYAADNRDGDVTNTLVVVSRGKFVSRNMVKVNYAAFDQSNNVGLYTRNVAYTDYVSPRFRLSQPMRFLSGNSSYDYLKSVRAEDCLDGDISGQVKINLGDMESLSDTISRRAVYLQVTNSAGDSSVLTLYATFENYSSYSQASPALSEYVIYTRAGERPNLTENISGIWANGGRTKFTDSSYSIENVHINDSGVDYNTPGVYYVYYQLTRTGRSGAEENMGSALLTLVVEAAA